MMKGVNWLGVVLAVVVNQAVGTLWYGFLFMQRWIDLGWAASPRPTRR